MTYTPEGVEFEWEDDGTIVSGGNTNVVTVTPAFDETTARRHMSVAKYVLHSTYEGCKDRYDTVAVNVVEPFLDEEMADTFKCAGVAIRLDAGKYAAERYKWTTPDVATPYTSSSIMDDRESDHEWTVEMERGGCKATRTMNVTVNSKPEIYAVDSVGYSSVEIAMVDGAGTQPFQYKVDESALRTSERFDSLSYHNHIAYVVDAAGCTDTLAFEIVPPQLKIKDFFTPNGDSDNELWDIPTIKETYPNAEIKIYDRFGKLLVTYKGEDDGWDGTYNGTPMPTTDYWYEITVREIDKVYTGHFTLLRR